MSQTKKPNNPQAFPCDYSQAGYEMETGMSVLDYNAIRFAQTLYSNLNTTPEFSSFRGHVWAKKYVGCPIKKCIAKEAYELSEAMLKERENYIK